MPVSPNDNSSEMQAYIHGDSDSVEEEGGIDGATWDTIGAIANDITRMSMLGHAYLFRSSGSTLPKTHEDSITRHVARLQHCFPARG